MSDMFGMDALEYSFVDEYLVSGEPIAPEKALWCAVIDRAMIDAANGSMKAREWLLYERDDFVLVCTLAGVSPLCVRSAARRMTKSS